MSSLRAILSGYFDLVDADLTFVGNKQDFYPAASTWLATNLPAAKQHPVISLDGPAGKGEEFFPLAQAATVIPLSWFPPRSDVGRVLSEKVFDDGFLAEVEVEREGFVMLKATYHPNWRVYVDDVEAEAVMLAPSYIGLRVAPGSHEIRLEYRSRPLRGMLMLFGLVVLVLVGVAEWRRKEIGTAIGRFRLNRFLSIQKPQDGLRRIRRAWSTKS